MTKKLITLLSIAMIGLCNAQNFYVSVTGGYGLGTSRNSSLIYNTEFVNSNNGTYKFSPINLGKGLQANLNVGYDFSKNMSAEIGFGYLMGGKTTVNHTSSSLNTTQSLSSTMLQIKPSFIMRGGFEKMDPYLKLGVILGRANILHEMSGTISSEGGGSNKHETESKFDGGMPFGYQGAVGLLYRVSPKMDIFGEVNLSKINYAPAKLHLTKHLINGVDKLPSMPVSEKEIEFVDSYNPSDGGSSNQPSKTFKIGTDLGSASFNLGIKYHF